MPLAARFILKSLERLSVGRLTVRLPDGKVRTFGKPDASPHAEIDVRDWRFFRRVLLDGYGAQRTLAQPERAVLGDAIACAEAFRMADWLPEALSGDWRSHRAISRFHARYPATAEIVQLVHRHLESGGYRL